MEKEKKKSNKKIFIIVTVVSIIILAIIGGIFGYNSYKRQIALEEQNRKEQDKLEKAENYFYEYLQETITKIEKENESSYSLCVTVSEQLKKYGEAKTFYSAYNSYYIRDSFSNLQTRMKTLDDIEPTSKKYNAEHQKVIELYNEYKDIYNIGITIPNCSYEDYAYTLAKEKAEYNIKLKEVRQLIPKIVKEEKY